MSHTRLKYLYQQYIADACTYQELQEFKSFLKRNLNDAELAELMDDTWDNLTESNINEAGTTPVSHIYNEIINRPQFVKNNNRLWLKVAASVMLIVSAGLILYHKGLPDKKQRVASIQQKMQRAIMPGGSKAVLTLANGNKVILDKASKGQIAVQQNAIIKKINNGQLVYASGKSSTTAPGGALNTLSIPTGGQYDLVLADGTKVFLNSESSLTYPTSFSGKQRSVTLVGEAYFEVAKNRAMPFKVNVANHQQVEVLGTHFNIMAYANDNDIKTTLLEGSVKISMPGYHTILKPGQLADHNLSTAEIVVQPANIEETMAWKNGYFKFHHEDIKSIMKKIARWYNIDVVYNDHITNHTFGGIYLRNRDLAELLKGLEYTGLVHFKTEGRRVTVMP